MKTRKNTENGQAMILLVLSMVVLLGFTALAIDGGLAYAERRQAQNAADSAALAGGLQLANGRDSQVTVAGLQAALNHGYEDSQVAITYSKNQHYQKAGSVTLLPYYLVTATITTEKEPGFMQFVTSGKLINTVTGVARIEPSNPAMPGFAIVAMGNCLAGGPALTWITGGGNSGGIQAFQGGIFVNTAEEASNNCAIDPGNNGYGVTAEDAAIVSVGSYDYSGVSNIEPLPVLTDYNGHAPIDDPLSDLPEPTCNNNGYIDGAGIYQPGNWNGASLNAGTYAPGIYCVSGLIKLSGNDGIVGDGVVFYLKNSGISFTGNGGMSLSAPTAANCLGTEGDTSASCTYKGVAIFMARSNASTVDVRGNGGDAVKGLIYLLNGVAEAKGGGSGSEETSVEGQLIAKRVQGRGNGSFKVTYRQDMVYHRTPRMSVER